MSGIVNKVRHSRESENPGICETLCKLLGSHFRGNDGHVAALYETIARTVK
jgi:hypothetical protein